MDEITLQEVAEATDGQYFRATDEERLAEIYDEINSLERSEISVKQFRKYRELFGWLLIPAVTLVLGMSFVNENIFRKRV